MAPLLSLLAFVAFALFSTAAASPHIARHVLDHRHNPVVPRVHIDNPVRRRSLNRRCVPSNSTTSPILSATSPIPSATSSTPPPPATSSVPETTPSSTPLPPTTSSAPETTAAAPTTTPSAPETTAAASTTTSSPPPAQTYSSSSNSGEPSYLTNLNSGQGTWFATGLGACGYTNNDDQPIVAVSHVLFDTYPNYNGQDPNTNPVCGKSVTITYQGKSMQATVVDRCEACQELDLDMTPFVFSSLASLSVGRIDMSWKFT